MFNYCWLGCLTVMYDSKIIGLIQIEDIKKNNDYAMWLKVCKKANCYLLDEVLAKYRKGRVTINLAISFPMSVFSNIISAHEKFVFLKCLEIIKNVLGPMVTLPLLLMGFRSIAMVSVSLIVSLITDICYS